MSQSERLLFDKVLAAVRRCRPIALRAFRSPSLRVERKADRSPVTAADRAVETELRRALKRLCPGERIVGEEFGDAGGDSSTYWTIDPIDGTRAFSRGLPTWAIMLGRVEHGHPTLGLCDFPALGVTIGVARGVRAFELAGRRRIPLQAPRHVRALSEAAVLHGGARWWQDTPFAAGFAQVIRTCYLERSYGDCYGYLTALRGQADVVLDYGVKVWDMAPLAALARATGRALINAVGLPSFTGPDTIMAPPALARRVAQILRGAR